MMMMKILFFIFRTLFFAGRDFTSWYEIRSMYCTNSLNDNFKELQLLLQCFLLGRSQWNDIIIIGNGYGERSSNPGRSCLHLHKYRRIVGNKCLSFFFPLPCLWVIFYFLLLILIFYFCWSSLEWDLIRLIVTVVSPCLLQVY